MFSYSQTVRFGTPILCSGSLNFLQLTYELARRIEFGGEIIDGQLTFLLYFRSNWTPDPASGWIINELSPEVPGSSRHLSLTGQIDLRFVQIDLRQMSGDPWTVARLHCSIISLPMWLVSVVLSAPTFILIYKRRARSMRQRNPGPYCEKCGYSLFGLSSNRCPECGTTIPEEQKQAIAKAASAP